MSSRTDTPVVSDRNGAIRTPSPSEVRCRKVKRANVDEFFGRGRRQYNGRPIARLRSRAEVIWEIPTDKVHSILQLATLIEGMEKGSIAIQVFESDSKPVVDFRFGQGSN